MPESTRDRTRMTPAVRSIMVDHLNIACVLNCLRLIADHAGDGKAPPDYSMLFFALSYIERFADTIHYPKEERFLFETMLRSRPDFTPVFAWLHREHMDGQAKLTRVRNALTACYKGDASIWPLFRQESDEYIVMQFEHMMREESEILPLAFDVLTLEDWRTLNDAFHHEGPLFCRWRQREFENLFAFIMDGCYGRAPAGGDISS